MPNINNNFLLLPLPTFPSANNTKLDHPSLYFADLQSIRKLLGDEPSADANNNCGLNCPSCERPFDKGKKRKLIDTCGHERCYSCMFKNEKCPICCKSAEGGGSAVQPAGGVSKGASHICEWTNYSECVRHTDESDLLFGPSSRQVIHEC